MHDFRPMLSSALRRRLPQIALILLAACATYSSALSRGQRAYEQGEDDRALAVLRALEPDIDRLPRTERARYCYLRGMTDLRLGYRADARHWLALAAAAESGAPGSLPADWSATMNESLGDLNAAVYSNGIASLFEVGAQSQYGPSVVQAADESSGLLPGSAPSSADAGP